MQNPLVDFNITNFYVSVTNVKRECAMKLLVYYSTFALALAISLLLMRCKEDSAPVEPQEDFPLIEQQHQISDEFVKNLQTTTLDSAYQRTLTWAKNQSYVSNASRVFNGGYI